jgi:hypothetical protein
MIFIWERLHSRQRVGRASDSDEVTYCGRGQRQLPKQRKLRAQRREEARALAKEMLRSEKIKPATTKLDKGWFLATLMALVLFLIAPKIGRGITAVVLVAMASFVVNPIWHLGVVQQASPYSTRNWRFAGIMSVALISIAVFGIYVWPPIKRHTLTARERESFENALKAQKGDDLEIQLACSPNDEKACTYAGQFIRSVGDSGWKVQAYVSRLMLTKPLDGVMIYRRGGNRDYTLQHYDAGGYFSINEPHLLAMQKAFQSIQIEPSGGANPDLPENVMMIYFGPERDNEADPTDLTRTTEWATGKREGPFPGKRRTVLCRWLGLSCG